MYEKKSLLFLYCVSPVHMGAGKALGVVDKPIQRERHTGHPIFAGSGIKGALRDEFEAAKDKDLTNRIFGPEADASDHAGCVAFGDAQLVAFPVRSLRESFVYATCPTALARLKRASQIASDGFEWSIPAPPSDEVCVVCENSALTVNAKQHDKDVDTLILESFSFVAGINADARKQVAALATWLSEHALPGDDGFKYFRDKLTKHLVLLSDTRFDYVVQNATTVEPHVRISDESGTADDGGLFYTENVPPEAIFVSVVMASQERFKRGASGNGGLKAAEVMKTLREALEKRVVQLGGDATAGRGLVALTFVG